MRFESLDDLAIAHINKKKIKLHQNFIKRWTKENTNIDWSYLIQAASHTIIEIEMTSSGRQATWSQLICMYAYV